MTQYKQATRQGQDEQRQAAARRQRPPHRDELFDEPQLPTTEFLRAAGSQPGLGAALGNPSFAPAQRQAAAGQVGRMVGNRSLQRSLTSAAAAQSVQRIPGDEESGEQSIYITHDVQLIPQSSSMSCWAASAAMLVSWRDSISLTDEMIASGIGYWTEYVNSLPPDDVYALHAWGLVEEEPQTYTVDGLANLLDAYGPLWAAAAAGEDAHVRVITGMFGDGTPDGTFLMLNDPAPVNSGRNTVESYRTFLGAQETLAGRELAEYARPIYIAHCP